LIINHVHIGPQEHGDHQTHDKARVAAATAPKTRTSNPIIAPDAPLVDWLVALAELVDEGTELELVTVLVIIEMLLAAPVVLEVAIRTDVDEGKAGELEASKLGAATAVEGSTSEPFPQGIFWFDSG